MHYKEPEDRNQLQLYMSWDLLLPSDHPIRIIDRLVEEIVNNNPKKFKGKGHSNVGQKAYSPKTFLKLYLYGYLNSISTSRKLELETNRNIEVKWLLGNLQPDFKTIADYRKDNKDQIDFVTQQIRHFLKSSNLIEGKLVAVDGTKIKANANRTMLTNEKIEEKLLKINGKIEEYLKQLDQNDSSENIKDNFIQLDELSEDNLILLKKISRLEKEVDKLKKAKEDLEQRKENYISLTDKDAKLLKSQNGKIPGHNVQVVVDAKQMMIMQSYISENSIDIQEIIPVVEKLEEEYSEVPQIITGDKGYYNADMIEKVEKEKNIEIITPIPTTTRDKDKVKFEYDKDKDVYICSEGKEIQLLVKSIMKRDKIFKVYQCKFCDGCPRRKECTKSKKGRIIHRYENQAWRDSFAQKMNEPVNKMIIASRKAIVEHVFGTIKYWMGQIPLKLRGKEKVCTEINIYSTVYNIKRLMNVDTFSNIMELIKGYTWKMV